MTIDPSVVIAFMTALIGAIGTIARFAYKEMRDDRNYWRGIALQLMAVNTKAIDTSATAVKTIDG